MRSLAIDNRLQRYCAWEGIANNSPSILQIGGAVVLRNRSINPKPNRISYYSGINGATISYDNFSILTTCTPGVKDSGCFLGSGNNVIPGVRETISVEVEAITSCRLRLSIQGIGVLQKSETQPMTLASGDIYRLSVTYTPKESGGTLSEYVLRNDPNGSEIFKVRKVCYGSAKYFDGDTAGRELIDIWP